MSSFEQFLNRNYKQTAVYWGNPRNDGYGRNLYDDPVEIKCRWENSFQVFEANDDKGTKFVSRAIVYVGVNLDYDGVLWLGTLAELEDYLESSSGSYIDPVDVPEAYPIKRTEKIPILGKPTAFVRVAYLTPWLNT